MRKLLCIAAVALAASFVTGADRAEAQVGGPYGLMSYGYPGLGFFGPYVSGRVPTPPYFALHPPVYYSQAVPRTYGHSPFAYPGTHVTPEAASMTAKMLINPHIQPKVEKTEASLDVNKVTQLEIRNPFVKSTKMVSID